MYSKPFRTILRRLCVVIIFSIAFAYIESAIVVYLRTIFHPDGFSFPLKTFGLSPLWKQLLLTEIGRETATMVLIVTGAWLFGKSFQERFAYFLTIFAVWDIFYYVWLKALLDWPSSIMDWDILFLIPITWASAVLYPVIISITMFISAVIILYRISVDRPIKVTLWDWLGYIVAAIIVIISFSIAGSHVTEQDFKSYFHWPIFAIGYIIALAMFAKCLIKS
jgi:hypothetical protein